MRVSTVHGLKYPTWAILQWRQRGPSARAAGAYRLPAPGVGLLHQDSGSGGHVEQAGAVHAEGKAFQQLACLQGPPPPPA